MMAANGPRDGSTFNAAAPSSRPHRYYREPVWAQALDQAKMFTVQLLCAGGSGAIAKTAVAPLERIKIILQVQNASSLPQGQRYRGFLDALRRIPQNEGGWLALYRGNGANVFRLLPEVSVRFLFFDQFKLMFASSSGEITLTDKLVAGAATGILRSLLLYPLDLCRTRITADMSAAGQPRHYATIRHCLTRTVSEEGVRGLYKGIVPSMLGIVPYLSLSMAAYDTLKENLPDDKKSKAQWWYPVLKMGAGSAAAMSAQLACYPLDTLRRRMQLSGAQGTSKAYRGAIDCLRTIWREEGAASLYKGAGISCLRTLPGAAIQFVAYDLIKTGMALVDPTSAVSSPL